eukprot:TRINITY_DN3474_c0_g3_i1.p1 TRINITY_DN3474_c0_g3~~TRINITY_DN3474_c0_g3_i1.p1  ORF type:complete len:716 (-),score=168.99 TRINITY_DN3474_c0_g3_i1:253-2400(-)
MWVEEFSKRSLQSHSYSVILIRLTDESTTTTTMTDPSVAPSPNTQTLTSPQPSIATTSESDLDVQKDSDATIESVSEGIMNLGASPAQSPPSHSANARQRKHTELCRLHLVHHNCQFATDCWFAHSIDELKPIIRNGRYKTRPCRTFSRSQKCRYGTRCHYIHELSAEDLARQVFTLSEIISEDQQPFSHMILAGSSDPASTPSSSSSPSFTSSTTQQETQQTSLSPKHDQGHGHTSNSTIMQPLCLTESATPSQDLTAEAENPPQVQKAVRELPMRSPWSIHRINPTKQGRRSSASSSSSSGPLSPRSSNQTQSHAAGTKAPEITHTPSTSPPSTSVISPPPSSPPLSSPPLSSPPMSSSATPTTSNPTSPKQSSPMLHAFPMSPRSNQHQQHQQQQQQQQTNLKANSSTSILQPQPSTTKHVLPLPISAPRFSPVASSPPDETSPNLPLLQPYGHTPQLQYTQQNAYGYGQSAIHGHMNFHSQAQSQLQSQPHYQPAAVSHTNTYAHQQPYANQHPQQYGQGQPQPQATIRSHQYQQQHQQHQQQPNTYSHQHSHVGVQDGAPEDGAQMLFHPKPPLRMGHSQPSLPVQQPSYPPVHVSPAIRAIQASQATSRTRSVSDSSAQEWSWSSFFNVSTPYRPDIWSPASSSLSSTHSPNLADVGLSDLHISELNSTDVGIAALDPQSDPSVPMQAKRRPSNDAAASHFAHHPDIQD